MDRIRDYKVDYTKLANCIRTCAVQGKSTDFTIDLKRLNDLVQPFALMVVPNNIKSKRIGPEDIPYLGEFFKKTKLKWLDRFKFFSSVVFVRTDIEGALDHEFYELIHDMTVDQLENPDIDKTETMAKILAKYPCYVASVVSYKNADIKMAGTISFEIICKANIITIEYDNAYYHSPEGMPGDEDDIKPEGPERHWH